MGEKPASLFSSTEPFAMELAELATDVAVDIAEAHDWRALQVLATVPGDATTIAFDLPGGYDRMLKPGKVHSLNWKTANFRPVKDEDEWIYIQDNAITGTPGSWIILGGQFQVFPAMAVGEVARFYYISNKIVAVGAGSVGSKAAFTVDSDTFVLPERLLTLGLIWRWRSQKRMEYAEDMANYEVALSHAIAKDKGRSMIVVGAQRVAADVALAYPGVLGRS